MSTSDNSNSSIVQDSLPTAAVKEIKRLIFLRTAEEKVFELEEDVAMESDTLKKVFQENDVPPETILSFPYVQSWQMEKVIEYCTKKLELKKKGADDGEKEMKAFQAEFIQDVSATRIVQLLHVANQFEIEYFLNFLFESLAEKAKNTSVDTLFSDVIDDPRRDNSVLFGKF
ncbi:SKP1-like protein 20 [Rosa chinensis]|uniref:SKP1-like protein 20 n=1 Tax=Rosa chinensis TaxID=74649 RepID=UPI000D094EE3|nr:SKP1-like protein 20 [Rosa chinensis]